VVKGDGVASSFTFSTVLRVPGRQRRLGVTRGFGGCAAVRITDKQS